MLMQDDRLRVDSSEGSRAREYRIDSGSIQVRTLISDGAKNVWRTLTSDDLSSHVKRNTVVAQWLERRLGWRRLLLACVGEECSSESRSGRYEAA
jgi:hypothetical protein